MGADREVPLASFRGAARPVLLAGSSGYISRALKASELHRTELRLRGISVIPLVLSSKDPSEKLRALKAEFRSATFFQHPHWLHWCYIGASEYTQNSKCGCIWSSLY